jgi:hypothetical protein
MAASRDPREENIRALEQLRGGDKPAERRAAQPNAPVRSADEPIFPELPTPGAAAAQPLPPLPPRRALPRPGPRPAGDGAQPVYHCLECGYALLAQSDYRCSECGKAYDPGFLAAWFEGTEEERFNHLTFLVTFALVVKVSAFLIVAMAPITVQQTCVNLLWIVAGTGASIAACVLAGRDRMDSIAGYYSIAGCAAGGIAGIGVLFGQLKDNSSFVWPAMVFAMDALSAAMLLLTLTYPVNGVQFWRARSLRKAVLPFAIVLLPAVFVLYTLETKLRESFAAAGGIPTILLVANTTTLTAAGSAVMWLIARQWLVSFRRMVFVTNREDDETQQ